MKSRQSGKNDDLLYKASRSALIFSTTTFNAVIFQEPFPPHNKEIRSKSIRSKFLFDNT